MLSEKWPILQICDICTYTTDFEFSATVGNIVKVIQFSHRQFVCNIEKVQQKFIVRTPYFCHPMKNYNLRMTVEDFGQGQYNFYKIILAFQ